MVTWKAAFALRMVDDYSGKCIQRKKFRFTADGIPCQTVEKEEGLYVFLEPMGEKVEIGITGTDYYDCTVTVEKRSLDPLDPVADVRLFGKPGRSFPYRCGLLTGQLPARDGPFPAWVYAKRPSPVGLVFKESQTVGNSTWITFSGFTREPLLGKTFGLGSGKKTDVFIIAEKRGINEYRIEGSLKEKHKAGIPLERIYRSRTDEKGAYAIFVECGDEAQISEVMTLQYTVSPEQKGGG